MLGGDDLADTSVVHQHLGAAHRQGHFGGRLLHERLVGDVATQTVRRVAFRAKLRHDCIERLQIEQHDRKAGLRECLGRDPTETLSRTRDDCRSHLRVHCSQIMPPGAKGSGAQSSKPESLSSRVMTSPWASIRPHYEDRAT